MKYVQRETLIKTYNEYKDEHTKQLQAMIDSDVFTLNPALPQGKQPKVTLQSFRAEWKQEKNYRGSDMTIYGFGENRRKVEFNIYGVVFTINAHQETLKAYIQLQDGTIRQCFLGDLGRHDDGGVCWIPTRQAGRMLGSDKGQHYLDGMRHLWEMLLDEDSSFMNHLAMFMFTDKDF